MRVLLLHGFSGGPPSFLRVLDALPDDAEVLIPPLVGHRGPGLRGSAVGVRDALGSGQVTPAAFEPEWERADGFEQCVDELAASLSAVAFSAGLVCGYSLGARLALGLACRHPQLVRSAVLIGVHPGLNDPQERHLRRREDAARAEQLRQRPLTEFVDDWQRHPVLQTQDRVPPAWLEEQRALRLSQDSAGLAHSLECMGLAAMPDYSPQLARLSCELTLVTGELDQKFTELARQMCQLVPRARHVVIDACGHNALLERPSSVGRILRELST
jgi:2-succinyl-6-hydroxy-2,4-cyclohexadiene-1-carboxylate synthase